jgi:hypothetical protein
MLLDDTSHSSDGTIGERVSNGCLSVGEQGVDDNDISVSKAKDQSWISFEVLDDEVSADIWTWTVE